MPSSRPLHIYGMVRFYQDLREGSGETWHDDQSTLAAAVLQRIDAGEEAFGYHVVVVPSPGMHAGRWNSMFNPATQTLVIRVLVHEHGGVFTPEETAVMASAAREMGMAELLKLIASNHPEAGASDSQPAPFDFYAIGRAFDGDPEP